MTEIVGPGRFAQEELHHDPDAPLRNFVPVPTPEGEIPRDRFGNRVFTSTFNLPPNPSDLDRRLYANSNKAYLDRQGEETKAAILVSLEGEEFLRDNSGILNDLDSGLLRLTQGEQTRYEPIILAHGGILTELDTTGRGSLSNIYVLETKNGRKYIIKAHRNPDWRDRPSQTYINEMLQTQAIATDLKSEFDYANMELPTFLFASGFISCTEYVEGERPTYDELSRLFNSTRIDYSRPKGQRRVSSVNRIVLNYILSNRDNPLWNNIYPDSHGRSMFGSSAINRDNFIKRFTDGRIVWIDPFAYFTTPPR